MDSRSRMNEYTGKNQIFCLPGYIAQSAKSVMLIRNTISLRRSRGSFLSFYFIPPEDWRHSLGSSIMLAPMDPGPRFQYHRPEMNIHDAMRTIGAGCIDAG